MLTGEKTIAIPAAPADVYARVADVGAYPQWQSFVAGAEVRQRDAAGRPVLVDARLDAKVQVLRATLRYAFEESTRVAWTQEHGDVKALEGAFLLAADGDGTRVTMTLRVDPGFKLGLLLRGPVEDKVRSRVLDGTLAELAATFD